MNIDVTKLDKIMDRVKKLLAMAKDASSPNEAAIAAKRARSLMDKYQLEESNFVEESDFNTTISGNSRKFYAKWENILSVHIAKLNDCHSVMKWDDEKPDYRYIAFRGFTADVFVAKHTYEYLIAMCKAQCTAYLKGLGHDRYNARLGTQFKQGFVTEVGRRIKEILKEREKLVMSSGKELMVVKSAQVEAHFGEFKTQKSNVIRREDIDSLSARSAGVHAGQQANIHMSID